MQEPGAKQEFFKAIKIVSFTLICKLIYDYNTESRRTNNELQR